MKIQVKEIDKLVSKIFKDKTVSEYIIYLKKDDTIIEAKRAYGADAKDLAIKNYMVVQEYLGREPIDALIEEITFEEFKEQSKL